MLRSNKDERLSNDFDNGRPFGESWLNTAFMDTLLPTSKWHRVSEILCENLCDKVRSQFDKPDRKQMLLLLVGSSFRNKFMPEESLDPLVLQPPNMSLDKRRRLQEEAQTWLQIQLKKAGEETRCMRPDDAARKGLSLEPEMFYYVSQAMEIFQAAMEKEMTKKEVNYIKDSQRRHFRDRTGGTSQLSKVDHSSAPTTAVSSVPENVLPKTPDISPLKGPSILCAGADMYSSIHSEHLSSGVVALLARDPSRVAEVSVKLSGRRLPQTLRVHIWRHVLLDPERSILKEGNISKIVRERFTMAVARGVADMGIQRATQSPVRSVIEHLVIEQFERNPGMKQFNTTNTTTEAVRSLNVLYVYNRSYDAHLVLWLFPFQLAFAEENEDSAAHVYELAMLMSLLIKGVYPDWPAVFAMAEKVMILLREADPEYYDHLIRVSSINFQGKGNEFLMHLLSLEREKAVAIMNNSSTPTQSTKAILSDPLLFIRKWIGEGFVSVLGYQAMMFLWDQLMMENFKPSVFEDMALAILLLHRPSFLDTKDYPTMKKAFLELPSRLYTADVIRAWVWLHRGGNPDLVPEMNRMIYEPEPSEISVSAPPTPLPPPKMLPPIGLNEFSVKLVTSKETQAKINWLNQFDAKNLILRMRLYYGTTLLETKETKGVAESKSKEELSDKSIVSFSFPKDTIIFENIDVSSYDLEVEFGGFPFVVISTDYTGKKPPIKRASQLPNVSEVILGWSMIGVIKDKPQEEQDANEFEVINSRDTYPIHPGALPEDMSNYQIPDADDKNEILCLGSQLSLHIFNAKLPPSPPPKEATPVKEKDPTPVLNEKEPTPKPSPEPTKEVVAPPTPIDEAWVEFDPKAAQAFDPVPSKNNEPFCLYLDQLRFVPDIATIFKVTGRIFRTGVETSVPDLCVYPDVESLPRSPTFRPSFRVVFNLKESQDKKAPPTGQYNFSNDAILLLRVYTVEKIEREIIIMGNFIVKLFDDNGKLLVGGYQKRLRNQMPQFGLVGVQGLNENSLDNARSIPGVSITYRLMPYTKKPIAAPNYSARYYRSQEAEPTDYEWRLLKLYLKDKEFPTNFREVVRELKLRDKERDKSNIGLTSAFMNNYIPKRLDINSYLPPNTAPRSINSSLMLHYRIGQGIRFKLNRAYGLASELLVFSVVRVIPGQEAAKIEPSNYYGYGLDEWIVVGELDINSLKKSPIWLEQYRTIKPRMDPNSLLIIQVFGLDLNYKDGTFLNKEGKKPVLSAKDIIGWSAFNLFDLNFVNAGKHQLPIFSCRLHSALIKRFQSSGIATILQNEEQFSDDTCDSLVLSIIDGNDDLEEVPSSEPLKINLLEANPVKRESYKKGLSDTSGELIREVILNGLAPNVKNTNSDAFRTEAERFPTVFKEFCQELVDTCDPREKRPFKPLFIY